MKKKSILKQTLLLMLFCLINNIALAQEIFTNPILDYGPDPYSTYHNGYYYYTHTMQDRLVLLKTKSLADLKNAEKKTIWIAPKNTDYSAEI